MFCTTLFIKAPLPLSPSTIVASGASSAPVKSKKGTQYDPDEMKFLTEVAELWNNTAKSNAQYAVTSKERFETYLKDKGKKVEDIFADRGIDNVLAKLRKVRSILGST